MAGPVIVSIALDSPALHVVSSRFRLYVGLSRDGEYLHVVSPRQTALTDIDGNVVASEGTLACTCKGATFHGHCYRLAQAIAFESGQVDVDVWTDAAPGELVEAFGS